MVYLAVDTAVAAMLVLTYSADRRRKNELQRMEESGISVLIRTTDPNVNAQMVSRLFGIDVNSVAVLEGELGDTAQKLMEEKIRVRTRWSRRRAAWNPCSAWFPPV